MAEHPNTIKKANVVAGIEQEVIESFRGEYDRLAETLGLFNIDTVAAGTALYQYAVSGSLNDGATGVGTTYAKTTDTDIVAGKTYYTLSDGAYSPVAQPAKAQLANYYEATMNVGASSGTAYIEGDFIARSQYTVTKTPVGDVEFVPYAKQTTAQAILKGGFEGAVLRTDKKAMQQMRADIMTKFFGFLANGTTVTSPASGTTWNLQQVLAHNEAALLDVLESNSEEGGAIVHFVNRADAYDYLANATVSTQDMFGMTYIQNFLGVQNVLLTNKVAAGTVYATPAENIHVYGIDFGTLAETGLAYQSDSLGLIGIAHDPSYDYASAVTYLVRSANFVPEVTDFIAKGSTTHVA
ncbi:hypothetical protein [Bifidobacterium sp.]|uniref:hypothetical protein n=1 Tax=Bifidobacterium sp. TaxID=41200 RepID=UPI00386FE870